MLNHITAAHGDVVPVLQEGEDYPQKGVHFSAVRFFPTREEARGDVRALSMATGREFTWQSGSRRACCRSMFPYLEAEVQATARAIHRSSPIHRSSSEPPSRGVPLRSGDLRVHRKARAGLGRGVGTTPQRAPGCNTCLYITDDKTKGLWRLEVLVLHSNQCLALADRQVSRSSRREVREFMRRISSHTGTAGVVPSSATATGPTRTCIQ
jgi:hypothetical protein